MEDTYESVSTFKRMVRKKTCVWVTKPKYLTAAVLWYLDEVSKAGNYSMLEH